VARFVARAIAKAPERRFSTARGFVVALDELHFATDAAAPLVALLPTPAHPVTKTQPQVGAGAATGGQTAMIDGLSAPIDAEFEENPTVSTLPYVRGFEVIWRELLDAVKHHDKDGFIRLTDSIVHGVLREAIGYRIEYAIPYFRGTVGYMVDAPMLWIRHSRFPILFVAFNPAERAALPTVIKQLEIARAAEFFAVLVVVPTDGEEHAHEAEMLRREVSDSVFQHDFVVLDGRHLASIIQDGSTQRLVEVVLRQGIGLYSLSPYVVNGPVPERMFFGREQEVKVVSQNIADRDYVVLGGRRIGKSSLLQRINRLLNSDPRYQAVYINCEDKVEHSELLQALGDDFSIDLDSADPRSFRTFVAKLAKGDASRRLVFVMDEIDELLAHAIEADGLRLFRVFRSLSHEGACRFVFSGSRTVHSYLRNPQSPFFNFCEAIVLRPLDDKSIAEIVTRPMRQLGIDVGDEDRFIQLLIELTSSHPNVAQWVCDRLVKGAQENLGAGVPARLVQLTEALRANRRTTVDELEALGRTREFQEYYLATAWGDAQPIEKLISLVAPGPGFTRGMIQQALAEYDISDARRIADALDILELYSIVERRGEEYRYRLAQLPRLVREFDGLDWQLDSVVHDLKRQAWS
jgi:hypothetical protein